MAVNQNGQIPDTYLGVNPTKRPETIRAQRDPTTSDRRYKIGTNWINELNDNSFVLTSVANASATWIRTGINTATDSQAQSRSSSDVTITPSNLAAEGFLQWADVTLTSSEVKNLTTTQIELVAAQGSGTLVKFVGAQLKLNYGGSNVFTESGDNLAIKYTDDSGVQVSQTIETTGFIDQSADTYTNAEPKIDAIVAASAGENAALVLDNLGSDIAGNAGNDNTVTIRVYYLINSI